MVNFNPNIGTLTSKMNSAADGLSNQQASAASAKDISKLNGGISELLGKADAAQKSADVSITDLISGSSDDINTVVAQVAKADMSFKVLVGVRNKLLEAYKQTMNMPV